MTISIPKFQRRYYYPTVEFAKQARGQLKAKVGTVVMSGDNTAIMNNVSDDDRDPPMVEGLGYVVMCEFGIVGSIAINLAAFEDHANIAIKPTIK